MTTRRRRRRALIGIIVCSVLLAGWLVLTRTDATVLEAEPPVAGYSAVYEVVDSAVADAPSTRTEIVHVARPYAGRVESLEGPPPGDVVTSGRVTNRLHLWVLEREAELSFGAIRPPGGPARDVAYGAFLGAVDDGLAEVVGTREILGRRCTVFAYRDPVPQPLAPASAESRVETCVDPAGIVLGEVWELEGRPVRVVTAVELDLDSPVPEVFLEELDPETAEVNKPEGREVLAAQIGVKDDGDAGPLPLGVDPPDGYDLGRSAIAAMVGGSPGGPGAFQVLAQAFVKGPELVVVELATSPSFEAPWEAGEGSPLEIGLLGEGRIVYYVDHVEVRLRGGAGFARISAPDRASAIAFAERVHAT